MQLLEPCASTRSPLRLFLAGASARAAIWLPLTATFIGELAGYRNFCSFDMATTLQIAAGAASGVGVDRAMRALQASPSLFCRLGEGFFRSLSSLFYERVYQDPILRELFSNTTREAAERNQREFLLQTFGDPTEPYRQRKGATAIIGRHAPYPVDENGAERWLGHMKQSLVEMREAGVCDDECKEMLEDYFAFMAYYIVEGRKYLNPGRTVGYHGKHVAGQI